MISDRDLGYLHRTLELAARGGVLTRPNPLVGAVVVRDDRVLAEGWHHAVGGAHAEVDALDKVAGGARGAVLYVNLEPCSHHGRTPPCVERIVKEGITRVVACSRDPNPRVPGGGFKWLREHGVAVDFGALAEPALHLNRVFFKNALTSLPWVILKAGASLDGKIATRTGESKWITGEAARRSGHELRARADAVLVGIGTVLADDPGLDVRLEGVPRQPITMVVDSMLRTPPTARLLSRQDKPVLMYACDTAPPVRRRALEAAGATVVAVPRTETGLDLRSILSHAHSAGVCEVLVEGGGAIHGSMLQAGLADELVLFLAPLLIGGASAPGIVGGEGVARLSAVPRLARLTVDMTGCDLRVQGRFEADWVRLLPAELRMVED
ncbi:bifunctional diaminohydroxyphosphoribosylaminopyrimidine deaminase/5-amino-6-(5-phosphoribosylamino)uracil reductase RibD [bacterium]|nr:bifunctional diaminohydroxyphosphoribosylaminopyrimidine deaminase/5-amino-6-(5-phosphoribosylamino)uracil reductase RibD [candidate division CSSED10-310 bacterium]